MITDDYFFYSKISYGLSLTSKKKDSFSDTLMCSEAYIKIENIKLLILGKGWESYTWIIVDLNCRTFYTEWSFKLSSRC